MMVGLKRALFREPRAGNMAGWLWYAMAGAGTALGCYMVVNGLLFSDYSSIGGPSYSPGLVALGSMFTLQFAAELLPKGWGVAAGYLRVGAICVAVASLFSILTF